MTRAIRQRQFIASRVKPAMAAKPPWPLSGIASDAAGNAAMASNRHREGRL
jgi:hypothetical protein